MSEPTARTEEYLDALAKAATRIADALDRMEPRHFDATATARVVDLTADLTAPTTYNPGGQLPHGWTRDWLWNGHAAPMSAAEAGQATQDAASPSGGSVDPPATAGASGDVLDESDHRVRHWLLEPGGDGGPELHHLQIDTNGRWGLRTVDGGTGPGLALSTWAASGPLAFCNCESDPPDVCHCAHWTNADGDPLPHVEHEPEPDPLDESDHRDRLLTSGGQIRRHGERHWHLLSTIQCSRRHDAFSECALANWDDEFGPLTFAPEVDQ